MGDLNFTENEVNTGDFKRKTDRVLEIEIDSSVVAKAKSIISSKGNLSFNSLMSPEGGVMGYIKDSIVSESTPVMKISGEGTIHLSDMDKKIQLMNLDKGQGICVSGDDILAFQESVDYNTKTVDTLSAVKTSGLTNVYLEGPGKIAITTSGEPVYVKPPVRTDPEATVAWSGNLEPKLGINTSVKNIIGNSSRDFYQLSFSGEAGKVVLSPIIESNGDN